jgi:lysocardiolipin and lysophospholipid acyltransferase
MSRYISISQYWKADESRMGDQINHLSASSSAFQVLHFPEGTNLTKESKAKSDAFAKKCSLKPYDHVLHPRTTGFGCLAEKLKESEY